MCFTDVTTDQLLNGQTRNLHDLINSSFWSAFLWVAVSHTLLKDCVMLRSGFGGGEGRKSSPALCCFAQTLAEFISHVLLVKVSISGLAR